MRLNKKIGVLVVALLAEVFLLVRSGVLAGFVAVGIVLTIVFIRQEYDRLNKKPKEVDK